MQTQHSSMEVRLQTSKNVDAVKATGWKQCANYRSKQIIVQKLKWICNVNLTRSYSEWHVTDIHTDTATQQVRNNGRSKYTKVMHNLTNANTMNLTTR